MLLRKQLPSYPRRVTGPIPQPCMISKSVFTQNHNDQGGFMAATAITQMPVGVPDPAEKVNVFISYAKADGVIAKALYDELLEVSRDRVTCFLDTESIDPGKSWEPTLNSALDAADWLVCIYTGEQSEFCGYEIGGFSKRNALAPRPRDGRLLVPHGVD